MKSAKGPIIPTAVETAQPHRRKSPAKKAVALVLVSLVALAVLLRHASLPARYVGRCPHHHHRGPKTIEQRVERILSETPLIDGHNDLPILIRLLHNNHIYDEKFTGPFEDGGMAGHVDLPRLRAGMNGGAFWSVFWMCPENGTDYSDEAYASAVEATYQQIDVVTRLKAAYPDDFSLSADSRSAHEGFTQGRLVSPLGIEGLHQIGNSATNLRHYFSLGVRYATLTHNCGNKYADAALWENPLRKAPAFWGGVSPEGRRLINEMNRIGMIVDLSHTSVDTMVDVLGGGRDGWAGSKAPVIFSHSSAYSVCPHPRNVPDHVLQLVKARDSVVMVNFAPDFVSCVDAGRADGLPEFYPPNATLAHVADHVMHIGGLIGFDHVGLGSDFDGIETVPAGLEDVSKYPDLVAELLRRGVSDEDAAKVVGLNVLRVWRHVETVARRLQRDGEPVLEDELPGLRPSRLAGLA